MSTTKKTILITGCSAGGIGAALAHTLASQGHNVYATARNTSKIPTELSKLANVTTLQLDVTSTSSITEAAKAVAADGKGWTCWSTTPALD
jgi:NAD(P)-dependent dehydrogenase (short-subunit alcohol dehydrogenase family)